MLIKKKRGDKFVYHTHRNVMGTFPRKRITENYNCSALSSPSSAPPQCGTRRGGGLVGYVNRRLPSWAQSTGQGCGRARVLLSNSKIPGLDISFIYWQLKSVLLLPLLLGCQ